MQTLHEFLKTIASGEVPPDAVPTVEELLARSWDSLKGAGAGGMKGLKLRGRTECLAWEPPLLTFRIERHGGTVLGSTRAEMHYWVVDVSAMTAVLQRTGRRQLYAMDRRLDVKPLAAQVSSAILKSARGHLWVKWLSDARVDVDVGKIIPPTNKRTTADRRRRFRLQ